VVPGNFFFCCLSFFFDPSFTTRQFPYLFSLWAWSLVGPPIVWPGGPFSLHPSPPRSPPCSWAVAAYSWFIAGTPNFPTRLPSFPPTLQVWLRHALFPPPPFGHPTRLSEPHNIVCPRMPPIPRTTRARFFQQRASNAFTSFCHSPPNPNPCPPHFCPTSLFTGAGDLVFRFG